MTPKNRAQILAKKLPSIYPKAHCELNFTNPLELLVATILSAQCTDKRVNMITPELFIRCPSAVDYATIPQEELQTLVYSTGFYRSKAQSIRRMGSALVEQYQGIVPSTIQELTALPGVGRKTANVVLGNAFSIIEGIAVDTHVKRLSLRLGLTHHCAPVRIEQNLMQLFARESWISLSHWLIWHGRRRCKAHHPNCVECELRDICPSADRPDRFLKQSN